jgi:hypothetical protein
MIMAVGNGRTGKSQRGNHLVNHDLRANEPFEVDAGPEPITMKFQYVGPLKFADLAKIHGTQLNPNLDCEVFIIDCEGLHALSNTPARLKQATFALAQMVSVTVLVTKEMVNWDNIDSIRSLFILSHAFTRKVQGFSIGTAIMMRDVGIRGLRDPQLSLEDKNRARQLSDVKQRTQILEALNKASIKFSERDMLVLGQPSFDEPELYWKSIDDFLTFAAFVASSRARIPGTTLLDLFQQAKPYIMKIQDFEDPSISFDEIIANTARGYLKAATDFALQNSENEISHYVSGLDSQHLRAGQDIKFTISTISRSISAFECRAGELFPSLLDYSDVETEKCRHSIRPTIQAIYERLFIARSLLVVVPELHSEIVGTIRNEIELELTKVTVPEIGVYTFSDLSRRYEVKAKSCLSIAARQLHPGAALSTDFERSRDAIQASVSDIVQRAESRLKTQSRIL